MNQAIINDELSHPTLANCDCCAFRKPPTQEKGVCRLGKA